MVQTTPPRRRVNLYGVQFDAVTEGDVIAMVRADLSQGRGGRIITPNVDILRRAAKEPEARAHIEASTVVVADGTPLIWAARLAGKALPARVPGSDLIWSLNEAAALDGRSVYLLGGEPGTAEIAVEVLRRRFAGIRIAGHMSPPFGFDTRPEEYAQICADVAATQPDIIFVGLGFPKQERVIARLRESLPQTWFMGCGAAIGFVAGVHSRAPGWMQRSGLEWVHRLGREPRRLARRYLLHDTPVRRPPAQPQSRGTTHPRRRREDADATSGADATFGAGTRRPRERGRQRADATAGASAPAAG
ncbi:WecB/TagA/CpsF family glycosyltransferase [Luedemannella flava]